MTVKIHSKQINNNLNIKDRDSVAFALRWAQFDSGDEYILPQFGITPVAFYRRLSEILRENKSQIAPAELQTLITVCQRKFVEFSTKNKALTQ